MTIIRIFTSLKSSPIIVPMRGNKYSLLQRAASMKSIQSPFKSAKIEPLIDNKGSHFGSLLLSFLRSAVCFTFVKNFVL